MANNIDVNSNLQFVQDNAPPNKVSMTQEALRAKNITIISLPPFSPDLNPIESVWCEIKNFIAVRHPDLGGWQKRSY